MTIGYFKSKRLLKLAKITGNGCFCRSVKLVDLLYIWQRVYLFVMWTVAYPFVCLGLTSLFDIWGHITTMPACSSGTLTNVLPHRNAMPQTQDMASHTVTEYRHRADLSLCYPLLWNVPLEYTATHFNVLGQTRSGNPFPTFNTHLYYPVMVVVSQKFGWRRISRFRDRVANVSAYNISHFSAASLDYQAGGSRLPTWHHLMTGSRHVGL